MNTKFRAWDNVNKVMLYEIDVYHDGKIGFDYDYAKQVYGKKFADASESWMSGDDYFWMDGGFWLMQYASGEDITDTLVCAGDILQNTMDLHLKPIIVAFDGISFCLDGFRLNDDDLTNFEIIGNIHQNPELLGGGK